MSTPALLIALLVGHGQPAVLQQFDTLDQCQLAAMEIEPEVDFPQWPGICVPRPPGPAVDGHAVLIVKTQNQPVPLGQYVEPQTLVSTISLDSMRWCGYALGAIYRVTGGDWFVAAPACGGSGAK